MISNYNIEQDINDDEEIIDLGLVSRIIIDDDNKSLRLYKNSDWENWDGGKIGGKPIWLNTKDIINVKDITCLKCNQIMSFLLQIYCPIDEIDNAFHRSIYIYCCRWCPKLSNNSYHVFRSQLPQENDIYPINPGISTSINLLSTLDLCSLCHIKAQFRCSSCNIASYCSKEHQKDHWKYGHQLDCEKCIKERKLVNSSDKFQNGTKYLFPDYDMLIEPEPQQFDNIKKCDESNESIHTIDSIDDSFAEMDLDISQKELNELMGVEEQDPVYLSFLTRISLCKQQVLRYKRWDDKAVLWNHSNDHLNEKDIPLCSICQTPRSFEFQVMPQLIYYLNTKIDSFDWGTLVIYTCPNNCIHSTKITKEYLHFQSPLPYDSIISIKQ